MTDLTTRPVYDNTSIDVERGLWAAIGKLAIDQEITRKELVDRALRLYLKRFQGKEANKET